MPFDPSTVVLDAPMDAPVKPKFDPDKVILTPVSEPAKARRRRSLMFDPAKMDRDRELLKSEAGRKVLAARNDPGAEGLLADIVAEGGLPAAGQIIGAHPVLSAPTFGASIPILGAVGGGMGNVIAQNRRISAGEQDKFKWGQLAGMTLAGAFPGSPEATGALALLKAGGKQAAAGLASKAVETGIDEGRLPTAGEALVSTAIPAAGGALAQRLGGGVDKLNSVERDTLEAFQKRGGKVVPSETTDNTINSVLEGIAGPSKVSQAVKRANANTVDDIARQEASLAANSKITEKSLADARYDLAQPYRETAAISPAANDKLEEWQKITTEALKDARKNLDLHPGPTARAEVKKLEIDAETAFTDLQAMAVAAGRPELAAALTQARIDIAKNHSVERALIQGSGRIDPAVLGRELERVGERGMTGGLQDIAKFQQAFSRDVGNIAKVPTVGVSAVDAMMGTLLAQNAGKAAGASGLLSGGIPLIRGPIRDVLLSKPYQALATAAPFAMPNTATTTRALAQASGQELAR